MIRLDKLLSHSGYGTRKEVKEFIRKGYVSVNGELITNDDFKVDEINDEIIFQNEEVTYQEKYYLMLNKPQGYVSATYDSIDPTVIDLIHENTVQGLFPVGRLDKDTEGLLFITNDGALAHQLLSPKKHVNKVYYLKYTGKYKEDFPKKFQEGITLDDGYKCFPAEFINLSIGEAKIIIQEGKFHQVKRMMEALNCSVTYLKRIQFGSLSLDDNLPLGEYRFLTEEELKNLRN